MQMIWKLRFLASFQGHTLMGHIHTLLLTQLLKSASRYWLCTRRDEFLLSVLAVELLHESFAFPHV